MRHAEALSIPVPEALALEASEAAALRAFESGLDPANPTEQGRARVIGYGEVSCALTLKALPGRVCKRMTGFANSEEGTRYVNAVAAYLQELAAHGIAVAETRLDMFDGPDGRPVAYLVQPLLPEAGLASNILRSADDARLLHCLHAVLLAAERLLLANCTRTDGRIVTLDAQLSNWWFAEEVSEPMLIDVGTPFMRRNGVDECGTEFLLAPVPALLRGYYRRQRAVETYIDDYFEPRALVLDILGNFHKEGRADRIARALPVANEWLASMGESAPVTTADADAYYRKDAADLELYLRIRRMDRWVTTRLFRRPYPFVLPGPVRR